eukprot:2380598-Lingulodinium_polyedra.AAC.1
MRCAMGAKKSRKRLLSSLRCIQCCFFSSLREGRPFGAGSGSGAIGEAPDAPSPSPAPSRLRPLHDPRQEGAERGDIGHGLA